MTTAPITVSMTLPLIGRLLGGADRTGALFRRPRLVIACRANPVAAAQHRAGPMVGKRGPGHVRLVVLFPEITPARHRHLVDHVMQPGMPFRRHLGAFGLAVIDDPSPIATEAPATEPRRLVAFEAVVAVAVGVRADEFAAQPSQQ